MIRISLLGQPSAHVAGAAVQGIERTPKKLAILAYLALHPAHKFVSREALLSLFWPESSERPARHALSQTLHFIRHAFGADTIVTSGTQLVRLNPNAVTLDVRDFEAAIDRNEWGTAAELYGGDLLEGLTLDESDAADWLDRERQRLRVRAADALWRHATELLEQDADTAVRAAERAIRCDPTRETACLAFLETALQQKRIAAARTIGSSFRGALAQATGGDAPTAAFNERERELQTISDDEPKAIVEPAPFEAAAGEVKTSIVRAARPRWRAFGLALAAVAGAIFVVRTIAVRMAGGSQPAPATTPFVIQPIEAPEELRPFADAIVAHIADELNTLDLDVVVPGTAQTKAQPAFGYGFEARAFRTGEIAQLSYKVSDVASGQLVTAGVLHFGLHSNVVDVGRPLIKKIRLDMGRNQSALGNLSARERSGWERLTRQQSFADSLRSAGDFKAASQAYRAFDSIFKAERWSTRTALMSGVQHVQGLRTFGVTEYVQGEFARGDSVFDEAELYATDLMRRFPNRFEAREVRGLVRYYRVAFRRTITLAEIDSAIADLRPPTQDGGSSDGLTALSGLLLYTGEFAEARAYALAAQRRDVGLQNDDAILAHLFEASFNLGEDEPARAACKKINEHFPGQNVGLSCRLTLMGWSETEPLDLAEARRIVREGNFNDPPNHQASMEPHSKLLLAAVLFRAGQIAEARDLANAVDISNNLEVWWVKAAVLARLGDSTRARELAAGYAMRGNIARLALEKKRTLKGLLPAR